MSKLRGRWKTGKTIMDSLDAFSFNLKETRKISATCTAYVFDVNYSGKDGIMQIYIEFGRVTEKTFLNCGFSRNLTLEKDITLLPLAEHILKQLNIA